MKTYDELMTFDTYYERLLYLRVRGKPGVDNADVDRFFAETFYRSAQWKRVRRDILIRDHFCDLAVDGLTISTGAIVHHINPLTMSDILESNYEKLFAHHNLITTSLQTHNQIHYGGDILLPVERHLNDHIPWRKET